MVVEGGFLTYLLPYLLTYLLACLLTYLPPAPPILLGGTVVTRHGTIYIYYDVFEAYRK